MAIYPPNSYPYPAIHTVIFSNTVAPNALARPTPIPINTLGNTSLPQFNKDLTAHLPSAVTVIRNLIRGNTA